MLQHPLPGSYMAPEVLKGEKYNEKVDVFSISVIIWEIFAYRVQLPPSLPASRAVALFVGTGLGAKTLDAGAAQLRMNRNPKEGLTQSEYLDRVKQNAYDVAYQVRRRAKQQDALSLLPIFLWECS